MATVDELLKEARDKLARAPFQPQPREARLLLSHVLGWDEARVMSHGEITVPATDASRFARLLQRRLTGEPVAYLLGEREFFGRPFLVDSRVLVPRPETEHLIEVALENIRSGSPRILDLGTGTGCIAVTLALELPAARIVAIDNSMAATAVARQNIARHGAGRRISLLCSDLATSVSLSSFDLVVSNPPYVDPEDFSLVEPEVVDFEPGAALFAANRGESIIRRLLVELAPVEQGTRLCFEIGCGQGGRIARAFESSAFELLEIRADLAGIPRTVISRRR